VQAVAAENSSTPQAVLACPAGQLIANTNAEWGCLAPVSVPSGQGPYGSGWRCPKSTQLADAYCKGCVPDPGNPPKDVNAVVEEACLALNNCTVAADPLVLGDPCAFCNKVLQLSAW
jgi:hypothetical protein